MTVWETTSGIRRAKGCAVPQAGCRKTIVRKNSSAEHLEWARPATWFLVPLHAQPTAGPAYRRDALCWAWCWTRLQRDQAGHLEPHKKRQGVTRGGPNVQSTYPPCFAVVNPYWSGRECEFP